MKKAFVWLVLICGACNSKRCTIEKPERIQTIELSNNGQVTYLHEIELKGVSVNCDSTSVMTAINQYAVANTDKTPINEIQLFESSEHFDVGESLSQPKAYLDDRVISVLFDEETNRPESFIFYQNGRQIYQGATWKR